MKIYSSPRVFRARCICALKLCISIALFLFSCDIQAQLFQQDFSGGALTPATISASTVTNGTTYVNNTTPTNSQFTFMSSNGAGTSVSVNGSNKLEIVKTSNNGYFMRNYSFPGTPTSLLMRFDFEVVANTSSNSSSFKVFVGDNVTNSNSTPTSYHSTFNIGIDASGSLGWRVNNAGSFVTGSHTIFFAVNNSGGSLTYQAPDGSCETVTDDHFDVWIDNTKTVDDAASTNSGGTQGLSKFAIISSSGPASTCTIDNILIDPVPPTPTSNVYSPLASAGTGFTANWTAVSGVTGYYLDVAADNAFTTGLTTTYVSGASTNSYAVTGLTAGVTYYYRVRAASKYTVGTYQSCNSATQTAVAGSALSFTTQPSNISECVGGTASLTVTSGDATGYQWYSNTANSNTGGTLIPSATSASYTPPAVSAGTTYYYCVINNSTLSLASNVATVSVAASPTFSGVSQAAAVCGGQTATINVTGLVANIASTVYYHIASGSVQSVSVTASGTGSGSFTISATNANDGQTLTIDSVKTACTNSSLSSNTVVLSVNQTPAVPTVGSNTIGCNTITFSASTSYQINWYDASTGGNLVATNSATYTPAAFTANASATYYAEAVNGSCISPSRLLVRDTITIPTFTLTNSTIYSPVPVSPYTVNLPYTTASAGLNQYSITWTGAAASLFSNVGYTSLPASPVPLTLNSSAAVGNTYTGTITVKNSTTGCTTAAIPFSIMIINVVTGDWGSVASGAWSTASTWKAFRSSTGRFDSTVTGAPVGSTTGTNIWIIDGYTVTASTGGGCKNIHVLNGSLISGTTCSSPQNLTIYGSTIEVLTGGSIGTTAVDDLADGISINYTLTSGSLTITGTGGTIDVSKFIIGGVGANVTIDHDITVHYHGTTNNGGVLSLFNNPLSNTNTLTINQGKTLTMAKWANIGNGTNIYGYVPTPLKIIANGNLTFLPGAPNGHSGIQQGFSGFSSTSGFLSMNISTGTADSLKIGPNSIVTIAELYPTGISTAATLATTTGGLGKGIPGIINIASGGKLIVDSVADFRNANQIVSGAGEFVLRGSALLRMGNTAGITASAASGHIQTTTRTLSTSGRYSYESRSAQVTGDGIPSTVGALIVGDTATTLTLSKSVTATDSLRFNYGKLVLSTYDITTAAVKNYRDTNFVVTDNTGSLKIRNVSSSDVIFPVGTSTSSYNPATLNNTGTTDNYSVRVAVGPPPGITTSPRSDSAVNRNWSIVEEVAGGSNTNVTLQWNTADTASNLAFSRSYCAVVHSNGTSIDNAGSMGAASGAGPFSKSGTAFTSFAAGEKFGVSTSPRKFRSKTDGNWNDATSWEVYNPSGNYSASETEYPNSTSVDALIQSIHTIVTPAGTTPLIGNIQIDGLLSVLSDDISVGGNWVKASSGVLDHNNKIVKMVGANNTTITGGGTGQYFPYLTLAKSSGTATVSLLDNISIGKELTVTTGKLDLGSKDITLLSNAAVGTASFGKVGASGSVNYSGTGRFIVERYIPTGTGAGQHGKSWQLLATPTNGGQTINQAWQDTATSSNQSRYTGYGTQITSNNGGNSAGAQALGFDVYTAIGSSMKTFNPSAFTWDGVANTNSTPLFNKQGYMIFVRGDRTVTSYSQNATATNLRSKGKIFEPGNLPSSTTVTSGKYESVGNPYACAIDFTTLLSENAGAIDQKFYVWDPTLSTYGGWQTFSNAGGYLPTTPTTKYANVANTKIQSGQAFFVYSTSGGTINFSENDKVSGSSLVQRGNAITQRPMIRVQLTSNNGNTNMLLDGSIVSFDDNFSNEYDREDALKIMNTGENIGVATHQKVLSVEAHHTLNDNDTIQLNMNNMGVKQYQLVVSPMNMQAIAQEGWLIDQYTHTSTRISNSDTVNYAFDITNDAASADASRFMIVFKPQQALPVIFNQISANCTKEHNVQLTWSVASISQGASFEVERSNDGKEFYKIGMVDNIKTSSSGLYSFTDPTLYESNGYYRIKVINGLEVLYSKIVKTNCLPSIAIATIHPNPIENGMVNIQCKNFATGMYNCSIVNISGQRILSQTISITKGNDVLHLTLGKNVAAGIYQVMIAGSSEKLLLSFTKP